MLTTAGVIARSNGARLGICPPPKPGIVAEAAGSTHIGQMTIVAKTGRRIPVKVRYLSSIAGLPCLKSKAHHAATTRLSLIKNGYARGGPVMRAHEEVPTGIRNWLPRPRRSHRQQGSDLASS